MKQSTLQTLIVARTLLDAAEEQCAKGDRYLATSGLIILQDAFELILYAALSEKGFEDSKKMERFDDMLTELTKLGTKIPKLTTLKAMNRLRVTAKHYGQVMEPQTVQGHLDAVKFASDSILQQVVEKNLREIFITEIIGAAPAKINLDNAVNEIKNGQYLNALISIRKAFFLEFEASYCIYDHRLEAAMNRNTGLLDFVWTGRKADTRLRSAHWITAHVHNPFDYIQINTETWRVDAMEWGINTQILANIRELTPEVVQLEIGQWHVRYSPAHEDVLATKENAVHCLDLTIEAIRRKQLHLNARKSWEDSHRHILPASYEGCLIFEEAKEEGEPLAAISVTDKCFIARILDGFNMHETFYEVVYVPKRADVTFGYVRKINNDPLKATTKHILNINPPPSD